jgi:hypothetical protein
MGVSFPLAHYRIPTLANIPNNPTPNLLEDAMRRNFQKVLWCLALFAGSTRNGRNFVNKAKPFCIFGWEVWEEYKRGKANQGAAAVDGESIGEFEEDSKNNPFKIWNWMSSGSYFPPPIRASVGLAAPRIKQSNETQIPAAQLGH